MVLFGIIVVVLVIAAVADAVTRNPGAAVAPGLIGLAGLVLVLSIRMRLAKRRRLRIKTMQELWSLTPSQFEQAVADLLHDMGFRDVRRVGRAGDLAADITCRDAKGLSVVVQCKRYAPGSKIGSPDIQTFIGMMKVHHGADYGIFATTSEYSAPAVALARQHGLRLLDGNELARIINKLQRNEPYKEVAEEIDRSLNTPQSTAPELDSVWPLPAGSQGEPGPGPAPTLPNSREEG